MRAVDKKSYNSPADKRDQVSLALRDVLPRLEGVQLAHQLGQAVPGDRRQHLLPLSTSSSTTNSTSTLSIPTLLLAGPGDEVAATVGEDNEGDDEQGDPGAGVPHPPVQHHPLLQLLSLLALSSSGNGGWRACVVAAWLAAPWKGGGSPESGRVAASREEVSTAAPLPPSPPPPSLPTTLPVACLSIYLLRGDHQN